MRLTLVTSSLRAGGAERVLSLMANYWAARSWADITLITLNGAREAPFYPLHPAVRHRPLGVDGASHSALRALYRNAGRLRALRGAIVASAPHAVVAFLDRANVLTLLAASGLGLPVVVAERIDPRHRVLGRSWKLLRRLAYPGAARVVAQTAAALSYFPPAIRRRGMVIPNPVQKPRGLTPPGPGPLILAMGRLERQKGFDMLIDAFARLAPARPAWGLEIWGEGPLRGELEARRDALGLGGRVRLPGLTPAPGAQMARAGLFVLSSRYEGFPNVLCEAMACGLPAVSFDCPSGPRDIIRHEVDGVLVPPDDPAALAEAMGRLIDDPHARAHLAGRAPEVLSRFGVTKVMELWESLLLDLTSSGCSS